MLVSRSWCPSPYLKIGLCTKATDLRWKSEAGQLVSNKGKGAGCTSIRYQLKNTIWHHIDWFSLVRYVIHLILHSLDSWESIPYSPGLFLHFDFCIFCYSFHISAGHCPHSSHWPSCLAMRKPSFTSSFILAAHFNGNPSRCKAPTPPMPCCLCGGRYWRWSDQTATTAFEFSSKCSRIWAIRLWQDLVGMVWIWFPGCWEGIMTCWHTFLLRPVPMFVNHIQIEVILEYPTWSKLTNAISAAARWFNLKIHVHMTLHVSFYWTLSCILFQ